MILSGLDQTRFAIIGFPKCGTTALARALHSQPGVHVGRGGDETNALSMALPDDFTVTSKVNGHRFSPYVYSTESLERLLSEAPGILLICCIRDPLKSLISWRKMHASIATKTEPREHFAWREREFFSNCTPEQHYNRFSKRKLAYDKYLRRAMKVVPPNQLLIVSQEYMASDMRTVLNVILTRLGVKDDPVLLEASGPHLSFAERSGEEIPVHISDELVQVKRKVDRLVAGSGIQALTI